MKRLLSASQARFTNETGLKVWKEYLIHDRYRVKDLNQLCTASCRHAVSLKRRAVDAVSLFLSNNSWASFHLEYFVQRPQEGCKDDKLSAHAVEAFHGPFAAAYQRVTGTHRDRAESAAVKAICTMTPCAARLDLTLTMPSHSTSTRVCLKSSIQEHAQKCQACEPPGHRPKGIPGVSRFMHDAPY